MVSRFEERFTAHAIPLLERQFAIDVDFILADDSELTLAAMPEIEDVPHGDDRYQKVEGKLTIQTALLDANIAETGVLTRVRIRGEIYHVYGKSSSHAGLTVLNVRRKASEQDNTNMYDLNDQQAVWHEAP